MDLSEWVSLTVGILGTGIAVYQWAVLNENQKRRTELQYLLLGIQQMALSKHIEWSNQINLLPQVQDAKDLEIRRLYTRARDNFGEIRSTVTTLEGVIDAKFSASTVLLNKLIAQTKLNNDLQSESLKNPTLPQNQKTDNKEQPNASA